MTSAQVNAQADQRPRSAWSVTWRTALRQPRTRVGLILSGFVIALALFGPLISGVDPNSFVGAPFIGPSGQAVLGTDFLGQDVLQRVLHGGFTLLWMSVAATLIGVLVGLAVGMAYAERLQRRDAAQVQVDIPDLAETLEALRKLRLPRAKTSN